MFDINARTIARNRAQAGFRNHDFLFQETRDAILDRLTSLSRTFKTILYLGDPLMDGGLFDGLRECYPNALITCVPPENLATHTGHYDALISSLQLHWVSDLPRFLAHTKTLLKPDALILGALLGQDTLHELRTAFFSAELELTGGVSPRIIPFFTLKDLASIVQKTRLALPVVDRDIIMVEYETPQGLLHDLRGMGETNALTQRPKNFLQSRVLHKMYAKYKADYTKEGKISATFELFYFTAWTPHETQQQPLKRGSAKFALKDILG